MKPSKWNKSYQQLATQYGVKVSALKYWASVEGGSHDLNNDEVVQRLVGHAKNKSSSVVSNRSPIKVSLSNRLGFDGSKERLQQVELALSEQYRIAAEANDPFAPDYLKDWLKVQDSLKKTETEAPSVSEANRNSISIDAVRTGLGNKLNPLRNSLDAIPKRVSENLPDDISKIVFNKLRREMDRIIRDIYNLKFLEGRE